MSQDRIDRIRDDLATLIDQSRDLERLRLLLNRYRQEVHSGAKNARPETDEEVIERLSRKS